MSEGLVVDKEVLRSEDLESVRILTLNRPHRRNALNAELIAELVKALQVADSDSQVRAVVLTGTTPGFCAGIDLQEFQSKGRSPQLTDLYLLSISTPLIAAVEGFAIGGGFELALKADLIVAASSARFALPEARVGQLPWFGILRLTEEGLSQRARHLALTSQPASGRELHADGLVARVTPSGSALASSLEIATTIAHNAPMSVAGITQLARVAQSGARDEYLRLSESMVDAVSHSADAEEGAKAFREKRIPQWKGH